MKFIVYSHTATFYGAPKSMIELTNELVKLGHEIIYILPEKGLFDTELKNKGYEVFYMRNPIWVCAQRLKGYSKYYYLKHRIKLVFSFLKTLMFSYKQHKKFLKENKPDWVIINTSVAPIGLLAASACGLNTVLWVREPILNKNGWLVPAIFPKFVLSAVFKLSSITIGPSEFIIEYFRNKFNINNGIKLFDPISTEIKNSSFVNSKKLDLSSIKFGLVGSLSYRKGQVDFVKEMLNQDEQYKVYIFGNGSKGYQEKLEIIANDKPCRVFLMNFESDIEKIYQTFDVYINMGIDETFGRTTIEAMRYGKLVFGKRSGATPELIKHGETGFLFDNVIEIFNILNSNNRDYLSLIAHKGQIESSKYDPVIIANEFMKIIHEY